MIAHTARTMYQARVPTCNYSTSVYNYLDSQERNPGKAGWGSGFGAYVIGFVLCSLLNTEKKKKGGTC